MQAGRPHYKGSVDFVVWGNLGAPEATEAGWACRRHDLDEDGPMSTCLCVSMGPSLSKRHGFEPWLSGRFALMRSCDVFVNSLCLRVFVVATL